MKDLRNVVLFVLVVALVPLPPSNRPVRWLRLPEG